MKNPFGKYGRLALRALGAGLVAFVATLSQSNHVDKAVLWTALTSAAWVAYEAFTPANAVIGLFKHPNAAALDTTTVVVPASSSPLVTPGAGPKVGP